MKNKKDINIDASVEKKKHTSAINSKPIRTFYAKQGEKCPKSVLFLFLIIIIF